MDDIELSLSPRTGELLAPGSPLRPLERSPRTQPAVRQDAATSTYPSTLAGVQLSSPVMPALRRVGVTADARRSHLREAADSQDLDRLAAQALADPPSEFAALVLAGTLGRTSGDARADGWLDQAFALGREPQDDPLLAPHLDQLSIRVGLASWDIHEDLAVTREALGVAVALAEFASGDAATAYGVLLDTPDSARVCALRAVCCLELQWWARASRASRCVTDEPPWNSLLELTAGIAASRSGAASEALDHLDRFLTQDAGSTSWTVRALRERASLRSAAGSADQAWHDLATAAALDPKNDEVLAALKAL